MTDVLISCGWMVVVVLCAVLICKTWAACASLQCADDEEKEWE